MKKYNSYKGKHPKPSPGKFIRIEEETVGDIAPSKSPTIPPFDYRDTHPFDYQRTQLRGGRSFEQKLLKQW